MSTVTLDVRTLAESLNDFSVAWREGESTEPRISFASPELLWKTLTPKRWALLKAMTGAGPLAIREIARRLGRDVKGVHADVHALIEAGLIEREGAAFRFPYDAVHVDFLLRAA
jgi:predicted transcriptional regulator